MKKTLPYRIFCALLSMVMAINFAIPVQAQGVLSGQTGILNLPIPGSVVPLTGNFAPAIIKGVNIHPDNPFQFDFIIDKGDSGLEGEAFRTEANKLVKYFLASLTVPEKEMWVNLSPYEKNRIIPDTFGTTEMGRDLLAQDYLLKQLMASLMNPEADLGGEFWKRVYAKVQEKFGTTDIPINTFNKIWIVPEEAVVYEHEKGAFIVKSHLKVMLEEDYLALEANKNSIDHGLGDVRKEDLKIISGVQSQIIKDLLIPEIEKEVNEGKTFANLRQIYNSVILANWYKQAVKESLLGQVYVDQKKIKGIEVDDKSINEKIFNQYVESFKKGVYNFIKEDYDAEMQEDVPRKYFSGGANLATGKVGIVSDWEGGDFSEAGNDLQNVRVDLAMLSGDTVMAAAEQMASSVTTVDSSSSLSWLIPAVTIGALGIWSAVAIRKERRNRMIEKLTFRSDGMPERAKAKLLTSIRDKKVLADIAQRTHNKEIRQRVMQVLVGLKAETQIRDFLIGHDEGRLRQLEIERDKVTEVLIGLRKDIKRVEKRKEMARSRDPRLEPAGPPREFRSWDDFIKWGDSIQRNENVSALQEQEILKAIDKATDLYQQSMEGLKSLKAIEVLKELARLVRDDVEIGNNLPN